MRVVSIQVQIGAVALSPLTDAQIAFHSAVAAITTGDSRVQRLGPSYSVPVSHHEAVHETNVLSDRILKQLKTLKELTDGSHPVDTCIVDFCATPFFALREPLLLTLAAGIAESCNQGLCTDFTILLPKMPGTNGAFQRQLRHFNELVPTSAFVIRLAESSGKGWSFARDREPTPSDLTTAYETLLVSAYGDYKARLTKKCVRRLGHFGTYSVRVGKTKCRQFSYLMHDCGAELSQCFASWWAATRCQARGILFDLKNNDLLREVVVAHANRFDIPAERIVDVLANDDLAKSFKEITSCAIVLDAIDTGETLERYSAELSSLGIAVAPNVFAGVNKHGENLATLNVNLTGVITKPTEATAEPCVQCALRLPYTSDASEEFVRIRSFDMHEMVRTAGWIEEPKKEVPENIGLQYSLVPNFSQILADHGPWLAFKLYTALVERGLPEAWFVINPEEGDSSSFSQYLYDCVGEQLTIVRIPRQSIKEAQQRSNSWQQVIDDNAGQYWVEQLREMRDASALVLDIFNASDSTCRSLVRLVKHCGLQPLGYACLVDFKPDKRNPAVDGVPKIALYEWHSPRVVRQEA